MGKAGRIRLEEMFTEDVFEGRMKEIMLNLIQKTHDRTRKKIAVHQNAIDKLES